MSHGWKFEDLDGTSGSISGHNSNSGIDIAARSFNKPGGLVLFYKTNDALRYAYVSSNGWKFALLDGSMQAINQSIPRRTGTNPTATLSGNSLQVFYQENGILRHAWGSY